MLKHDYCYFCLGLYVICALQAGRESVWHHDPRTGWSYCITVPSWIVLAKSRDSDPTVVFYLIFLLYVHYMIWFVLILDYNYI